MNSDKELEAKKPPFKLITYIQTLKNDVYAGTQMENKKMRNLDDESYIDDSNITLADVSQYEKVESLINEQREIFTLDQSIKPKKVIPLIKILLREVKSIKQVRVPQTLDLVYDHIKSGKIPEANQLIFVEGNQEKIAIQLNEQQTSSSSEEDSEEEEEKDQEQQQKNVLKSKANVNEQQSQKLESKAKIDDDAQQWTDQVEAYKKMEQYQYGVIDLIQTPGEDMQPVVQNKQSRQNRERGNNDRGGNQRNQNYGNYQQHNQNMNNDSEEEQKQNWNRTHHSQQEGNSARGNRDNNPKPYQSNNNQYDQNNDSQKNKKASGKKSLNANNKFEFSGHLQ